MYTVSGKKVPLYFCLYGLSVKYFCLVSKYIVVSTEHEHAPYAQYSLIKTDYVANYVDEHRTLSLSPQRGRGSIDGSGLLCILRTHFWSEHYIR